MPIGSSFQFNLPYFAKLIQKPPILGKKNRHDSISVHTNPEHRHAGIPSGHKGIAGMTCYKTCVDTFAMTAGLLTLRL